ncbi:hypothetical protein NT01EI_2970 [Edwardsiella ictaluri 93-146]|uniref:Uncharacterized protein n=1 Tax=Edwardsiella ictaluri (strain 93-146) TaxID=634503 RepID=C5B8S1_EDWI9|nr:hypothetical protein NT01EI_2970 [Edwardsiella ictaluri 93-146]
MAMCLRQCGRLGQRPSSLYIYIIKRGERDVKHRVILMFSVGYYAIFIRRR